MVIQGPYRRPSNRVCRWDGCSNVLPGRPPRGPYCHRHWQVIRARERSWHWQLEQLAADLWGVTPDQLRRLAE